MKTASIAACFTFVALSLCGLRQVSSADEPAKTAKTASETGERPKWTSLFDGKALGEWKTSDFPGSGEVTVEKGAIVLGTGMDMTGVTLDKKIPKVNYEVELEAMRADGSDFFCGLTFPVKDKFCSLIVGGWGGGVVGLSSLGGMDASENETGTYREFETGKWYPIKLRVTDQRITTWIDGKEVIDADIRDRGLSTRLEVEWSKPFGIATWQTKGAIRKIRIRELPPAEVKTVNDGLKDL
ncbi:MAG: DUF1080 domain-containing protein [Planctomycetaceae bacterium]|nr:DUF1080 domain-containing protein [Planctomycetaceae bacterium]